MKKILLFTSLLLLSACSHFTSGRGSLLSVKENVSYYIKYDTRIYVIILEVDENTHKPTKTENVSYANVYHLPRDLEKHRDLTNEYLVYEYQKDLIIYDFV